MALASMSKSHRACRPVIFLYKQLALNHLGFQSRFAFFRETDSGHNVYGRDWLNGLWSLLAPEGRLPMQKNATASERGLITHILCQ